MAIINGTSGNNNLSGVPGKSHILNLNTGDDIGVGTELNYTLNGDEGIDLLIGGGNTPSADGRFFFSVADDILNDDDGQDTSQEVLNQIRRWNSDSKLLELLL